MDDHIGRLLKSPEKWTLLSFPAIAEQEEYIQIGGQMALAPR